MGKEYEVSIEATVAADPDQVWEAIASGPGVSSWYIGRTEIDDDTVRTTFGQAAFPPATVTTRHEPAHLAYRTGTAPDGRFQAFEFLIEGRDRSATVLRAVTSGFLPGDDWADEYESMRYGIELFLATLVEYLRHFAGRTGTPVTASGPPITDWPKAWAALHTALGLGPSPRPGDLAEDGGEVYFANPHTLALRTPGALYRYIRGFHGSLVAAHVIFPPGEAEAAEWKTVLDSLDAH